MHIHRIAPIVYCVLFVVNSILDITHQQFFDYLEWFVDILCVVSVVSLLLDVHRLHQKITRLEGRQPENQS